MKLTIDLDINEMLQTLDVAKDEFAVLYGNATTTKEREYYLSHMKELNNIILLLNNHETNER